MADRYNVAIMGATGAVGQVMLEILAERDFPIDGLKLLASSRSAGKQIEFKGETLTVEELGVDSFAGVDLVLASAGGALSREYAPHAVSAGAVVVDNTSAFRMDLDVPLVVPEINADDLESHGGIIANPNCSTIIMDMAVWPLHQHNPVKRLVVSTYQAISGAGARAMEELEAQTREVLAGNSAEPAELPHQIAFNLFSHNSEIGPDGYCEEETKMIRETRKIFHDDDIQVTVTCVRVPVLRAHSEAINLEFERPMGESRCGISSPRRLVSPSSTTGKRITFRCRSRPPAPMTCWRGASARIFPDQTAEASICGSAEISCARERRSMRFRSRKYLSREVSYADGSRYATSIENAKTGVLVWVAPLIMLDLLHIHDQ